MSPQTILKDIGAWFAKAFSYIKNDADAFAVTLTQALITASTNGLLKTIGDFIDSTFKTQIGDEAATWLKTALPKLLATELAIEALPDNPTLQDETDFANRIAAAVSGKSASSEFKTSLAANVYIAIETDLNQNGNKLTFATGVKIVEDAYQAWQAYQAEQNANNG